MLEKNVMNYNKIKTSKLSKVKQSYVTRNIQLKNCHYLVEGNITPKAGQLVLARVDKIGYHSRLELPTGRRAQLFVGDEIIISYGNRYAPAQFLADVPETLEECQLVASGGIAAKVIKKHKKIKNATKITPLGIIADSKKERLSLNDFTLPTFLEKNEEKPLVLCVTGSSMNGGKTTTAVNLIKGLSNSGQKVAAAKVTGTGSGLDTWKMLDAGAYPVVDFTDFGFPTTHKVSTKELENILINQINFLSMQKVDVIVLEIADGIIQKETSNLLSSKKFADSINALFFASGEVLSAQSGVDWLINKNLPVIAISGLLTASPVSVDEAKDFCSLPVLTADELANKDIYNWIINNKVK